MFLWAFESQYDNWDVRPVSELTLRKYDTISGEM